ncbi:MAG: acyl-ACP--UDP-N-acetylglucosamine O-acyltransferase [Victivallaceae bacterium]
MVDIDPRAVVSPLAVIGNNVKIGPFSVIEDNVVIGDDTIIDVGVKIARYTTIGKRCRIYLGALVGEEPQDHRCTVGIKAPTIIGDDVVIREYVTIHRSPFEGAITSVDNGTLLMAFVHLGHDCRIGKNVTIANQSAISGHVVIEDGAVISGYVLVHQFCRIGALAMMGGRTLVTQDVAPFTMLSENNFICGPNVVGLRRAGIDSEGRSALRRAIKLFFFRGLNTTNACDEILKGAVTPEVEHFVEFAKSSKRGMVSGDPKLVLLGCSEDERDVD